MNIDHLKLFVRIASTLNISMAGSELGLSPAVASSYINKLEGELGVRLIQRTTRKISLTNEGETFLPHAEEVIAAIDTARAAVGSGSLTPHGTLRVTAPASFGRMHIIPALEGFMLQYPKLKVDLRLSDRIFNLIEGGFDVAIRDAALSDSTLRAKKIANDKRVVVASPKYIESFGVPETPECLLNHVCVNLSGMETWHFAAKKGSRAIKTNSGLTMDNGEAVRDACVAGLGLAISSTWCSYEKLKSGELVEILTDYPLQNTSDLWAVYPSAKFLSPKVRVFIDYVSDYFQRR
jgi:DNA-binding transcriptional LysR family regulator